MMSSFFRHTLALSLALSAVALAPIDAEARESDQKGRYAETQGHDRGDRDDRSDRRERDHRNDRNDRVEWRNDRREQRDRSERHAYRDGRRDERRWDRYNDRRDHRNDHRRDVRGRVVYRDAYRTPVYAQGYRYSYAPPPRYVSPRYRDHRWSRGHRINDYGWAPTYVVVDYGRYGLRQPPRGHHWRRDDRGDWLLVAIASGIIADVIFN